MKFVAAYLLASLGADASAEEGGAPAAPSKEDVRRLLGAVGADVEEDRLDLLFARLEAQGGGVGVAELFAVGREQLAYAPPGGAAAVAGAPGAAAAGGAEAAKEEEEEKKKVEEEDEGEDDDFMLDLFG